MIDPNGKSSGEALALRARYGGNPEHKKNPGDFGLSPPSYPRKCKSLCDNAKIVSKDEALRLLKEGFKRGLISVQKKNEWPQNVWAISDRNIPLEAQLENNQLGIYHGYPMPASDPFSEEVRRKWVSQ
jgi:hypothetical protein